MTGQTAPLCCCKRVALPGLARGQPNDYRSRSFLCSPFPSYSRCSLCTSAVWTSADASLMRGHWLLVFALPWCQFLADIRDSIRLGHASASAALISPLDGPGNTKPIDMSLWYPMASLVTCVSVSQIPSSQSRRGKLAVLVCRHEHGQQQYRVLRLPAQSVLADRSSGLIRSIQMTSRERTIPPRRVSRYQTTDHKCFSVFSQGWNFMRTIHPLSHSLSRSLSRRRTSPRQIGLVCRK